MRRSGAPRCCPIRATCKNPDKPDDKPETESAPEHPGRFALARRILSAVAHGAPERQTPSPRALRSRQSLLPRALGRALASRLLDSRRRIQGDRPVAARSAPLPARIQPRRRILDVGCGFGGSSIYLAKKYGAEASSRTNRCGKLPRRMARNSCTFCVPSKRCARDFSSGNFVYGLVVARQPRPHRRAASGRAASPFAFACETIRHLAGKQLDSEAVAAFLSIPEHS